jgi:hypothetical protein
MAADAAVADEPAAPIAEPAAEPAAKAEKGKAEKAEKGKAKAEKGKGKKEQKAGKGAPADGGGPSIAGHPRAARGVARAKSWGALAGFLLGGYLALPTMTLAEAGERALIAGLACYLAAWAGAVFVWRRVVMLELKGREQELATARLAALSRGLPSGPPSSADASRAG